MTKIAILSSHNGSGFDTLFHAQKELNISIEVLISNNTDAKSLQKAKSRNIETHIINAKTSDTPDLKILEILKMKQCKFVFLSGYMKKLSAEITKHFTVINSHPSLLPKYGGKGMYGRHVHEAVIHNKESKSGCTLHYVNEVYDEGKIILQNTLILTPNEDVDSLETKIKELERTTILEGFKRCLN